MTAEIDRITVPEDLEQAGVRHLYHSTKSSITLHLEGELSVSLDRSSVSPDDVRRIRDLGGRLLAIYQTIRGQVRERIKKLFEMEEDMRALAELGVRIVDTSNGMGFCVPNTLSLIESEKNLMGAEGTL